MLVECPECKAQISSEAPACPACGHPARLADKTAAAAHTRSPGFLVAAAIILVLAMFTPRILVILPVMAVIILAIVSLVRKEKSAVFPAAIIAAAIGFLLVSESEMQSLTPAAPAAADVARISDWNWNVDPSFGTNGTIKWNVSVQNTSDRPIEMARVDFATYDASGKLIATTFTYVHAIPPGGTRSESSFADLYGNEAKANVTLSSVDFAGP